MEFWGMEFWGMEFWGMEFWGMEFWGMDYVAIKLIWWLLLALVLGFAVGWLSCGRAKSDP